MNSFGTGDGPVLLSNVNCNQNHSQLSQCVHMEEVALRDCDGNRAGVKCPNSDPPRETPATSSVSLSAILGAVCGALGVVVISIIVIIYAVAFIRKTRKSKN